MFNEIFKFELRYQLRQPIFYICLAIFFLLTFGAVTTDSVQIGGSIGNVNRNGSFVIMQIMLIMSAIGVFTTTAFVANAIHRDFEYNTQSLFFSKPITKRAYLGGRFLGTFLISAAVFLGVALAIAIGSLMPWLEAERIGPFAPGPYIFAMLVLVIPNIFLSGAIFFSLATLTRSMLYTYAGVAAFFVGYAIAQSFLQDLDNRFLASLLDPFGFAAFFLGTKYWTVFERNNALLPLSGALLWNRLLWTGLGAAVLAFTFRRFTFTAVVESKGSKKKSEEAPENAPIWHGAHFHVTQDFSWRATVRQLLYQTKIELNGIMRGVPFIVLVFLGALNIIGNSQAVDQMFDTSVFPVTHLMLQVIQSGYLLFLLIILTFYSGELVWRERSLKLNEVYDALPIRTWVFWASKLGALFVTVLAMLAIAGLTAMAVQTFRGFHEYQLLLYMKGLFLEIAPSFLMMAALALFAQSLINNKYAGFLFMVLYFISLVVLPAMHFEHHLYIFGTAPEAPYSDMNGYGQYVRPLFWFSVYWAIFSAILIVLAHIFWVRGTESTFALRRRTARRRLTPAVVGALLVASAGLASTGGYIFYNTNVLNQYRTRDEVEKRQADFEKRYKRYEGLAQPRIMAVKADVDIYPEERRVAIRGEYRLRNKTQQPIRDLHLTLNPDVEITSITIPGSRVKMSDRNQGYYIHELTQQLQPGAELPIEFDLAVVNRGFDNGRGNTNVVHNGTFFNNYEFFPNIGYSRQNELEDRNKRKKYGLPPVQRYPDVNDPKGRQNNYISSEADWLDFDTTVSTSADQIALAPGYLQKEWTADGRRYFHYKMDSPILGFWSYLSARYEVKRDNWNGVAIEVYYDKAHPYNVDRMIYGVKKSLDYFTKNFGPYQHRQVRIVEFPRYARFAQSFPNTIPFSESIGFIANLKDPEDIDYVFYVTAHEVAHQWWAHQVIGGNVQGATVMSETMSQYSALMVMEKEYGKDKMRRFLKYELDSYLRGRGGELVQEMPLLRVENQGYIHYRKGSLVMYALRDHVGEEALNRALAEYVRDVRFQEPPYTNSLEFLSYVKRAVPPEKQSILNDLFETITLYENRAVEAKATKRADGKYVVRITVDAKKYRADGKGKENQVAIDDWVDVGVLGQASGSKKNLGPVLAMEKKHITAEKTVFEFVVGQKPAKAGIDPLNKLIDRNPEDNVTSVSM